MSLGRRSARNFLAQVIGFGVSLLDRIVLTGVFVRAWGIEGFSDWTVIWSTASLLAMSELGFQTMLGNTLVAAETRGRHRAFQRMVELGIFFYAALAAVVLVAVIGMAILFDLSAMLRLHGRDLDLVVVALCLFQLLRVTRNGVTQVMRGKGEYHNLLYTDARATGTSVAMAVIALLLGAGPLAVALLYVLGEAVLGTGWSILMVRRRHRAVRLRVRRPSRRQAIAAALELRWYSAFQFNAYAMTALPILIVAGLGLAGAGLASFAVQRTLVNFSRTVASTFSQAVGVELATLDRIRETARLNAAVLAIAGINIALASLAATGLFLFGEAIIGVWTGAALGSRTTLMLLLLPVLAVAPAVPFTMLSLFSGLPRPQALGSGLQVVVALPLCVLLGSHFGVDGVAAALAAGEIVGLGMLVPLLTARHFRISMRRLALHSVTTMFAALLWSAAVGAVVVALIPGGMPWLLVQLGLWGVLAGGPVFLLALPPAQRQAILSKRRALLYRFAR